LVGNMAPPCYNGWTRPDGHDRRSFWSTSINEDVRFEGAPFRLNDIMSRTRFEEILELSAYHNLPWPVFKDDFHPVRYWPKWILGDAIKSHFAEKEVGAVDCWNGIMDDQPVTVFCFKEPDYVMSIMSTYGTVNEEGEKKKRIFNDAEGKEQVRTFFYTEAFHNHHQHRHVVDDNNNNNNRMQPILIEETWKTVHWPHRVFAFILGVTGVTFSS
jgi:hypothetical protein